MRAFGSQIDDTPCTFIDAPKTSLRVASLLVWSVCAFLLYKAVVEPPSESWIVWGLFAMFAVCCYSVIHEFMLRPMRVTTVRPLQRQIVIQETARWRRKELVASIPPGSRFEIFQCDSDNNQAYGVRIKSTDKGWVTVAEYVSKERSERLASDANSCLLR
jgi:hypothetical protein